MRNKEKKFPYPVLSKDTDDFIDSTLDFTYTIIEDLNFKCNVKVNLNNRILRKLVKKGKALLAVHVECPKTRFRKIITFSDYNFEFEINNKFLANRVEIASMIISAEDLEYRNNQFNEDYEGDIYYVGKNNILAYDNDITFDIERNIDSLENLPSIFSIIEDKELKAPSIALNLTETKIQLKLNSVNYDLYKDIRKNGDLEQVIASLFIMPALVNILSSFRELEEDYGNSNWFHSINKRLKEIGIGKTENISEDALKISQEILGDTFNSSLSILREISLRSDE